MPKIGCFRVGAIESNIFGYPKLLACNLDLYDSARFVTAPILAIKPVAYFFE